MTFAINIMEFKQVKKIKRDTVDFVYKFDPNIKDTEYIAALPTLKNGQPVTFQRAMKLTIIIGQIFGLNPVMGILENDVGKLRFNFYSGICLYSVLSVIGQGVFVTFCLLELFWKSNASFSSNTEIVFFACNWFVTIQFLKIAYKWPKLSRHIAKIESVDPNMDHRLVWKCNITCIFIMIFAAVEHGLSDLSAISTVIACHPDKQPYEAFLNQTFYFIWFFIPYNTVLGLISKFISIQCTFNWSFVNVFIICICWYLTARFVQVNERLRSVAGQVVPQSFWRTMREDYTKATNLVRQFDEIISSIVFISFASNLFTICFLILHTLELLGGYEHAAYFIFSISFLILRSLMMSLMAAQIHSTSAEAAFALYDVPSEGFNVEVQRFLDQVHGDTVFLSGLQFFSVKRGMVLTIAATIVTYELVLIQFTGVNPSKTD